MSDFEGISDKSPCVSEASQNYQDHFKEDEISLNNTYAIGATPIAQQFQQPPDCDDMISIEGDPLEDEAD